MSSRDRTILGVVLVIAIAVGGWFLLVAPKRNEASRLQTQINSQEAALAPSSTQIAQALHAKRQYAALTRELAALQIAIPPDDQVPQLIDDLQAAATHVQLTFSAISSSGGQPTTGTTTTTTATTTATGGSGSSSGFPSEEFSLTFNGRYKGVMDLMGDLTQLVKADNANFAASGRLVVISSVSISQGKPKFPQVTAAVDVTDYDIPSALSGTAGTGTTATGTPAADITSK